MRAQATQCKGWAGLVGTLCSSRGQMVVELAVVMPVVIVVALILLNLMGYVEACAAFDQIAPDAIIAHGVSPSGEQTQAAAVAEVEAALAEALGRESRCSVEVRAESVSEGTDTATFSFTPWLTRYVCTLTYTPWPASLRLPGITLQSPLALTHECSLVVDRYRPGVVV